MATNSGTKIAINERDNENVIAYNRGFFVVGQSKEHIPDFKVSGMLPWQPNFGLNRQKSHKMAGTSVVCDI